VAIATWPTPTNIPEVRTFCGLAGYYRAFVKDFAAKAIPLHNLTKKRAVFKWDQACEIAFLDLKHALLMAPILVAPCDEGQYVLDTDASDTALGAVLQQEQGGKLHVIGYASRTLAPSEGWYCITRRELLGVVYGLKKFRQHLLGRPIIVRTDHAALTNHMKTPEPIGQRGRWMDLLGEYDITVQHRPGRAHGNSDALSRRPCERDGETDCRQCPTTTRALEAEPASSAAFPADELTSLPAPQRFLPLYSQSDESSDLSPLSPDNAPDFLEKPVSPALLDDASHVTPTTDVTERTQVLEISSEPSSFSLDQIRDAQASDDSLQIVMQALRDSVKPQSGDLRDYLEEAKTLFLQWDSLVLENGVLYRRFHFPDGTTKYMQLLLPVSLWQPFIEHLHADIGHFGRAKTCSVLSRRAYFPGWRSFTGKLVRNCQTCSLHQRSHQMPRQAALRPMREFRPLAVVHAYLVGPLPEGRNRRNQRGFQYILSVIDSATRYLWLLPICHKTAESVAATLFDEVISRVSVPSAILTNRGGEFMGDVVEALYQKLGILHSTPLTGRAIKP